MCFLHSVDTSLAKNTDSVQDQKHPKHKITLFDYYLIKKLYKQDIDSYLKWIETLLNIDCSEEKVFLSTFEINKDINEKLLELVNAISEV